MNCCSRKIPGGFSLIEIVLALGIMSFALVSILGLFPLALDTARESKFETRMSLIGQSILSDIQASIIDVRGPTPIKQAIIFTGLAPDYSINPASFDDLGNATLYTNIDLRAASDDLYFAFDINGQILKGVSVTPEEFTTGMGRAAFLARISAKFNTIQHPNLTHLEIRVEYPAAAAQSNRSSKSIVTLL